MTAVENSRVVPPFSERAKKWAKRELFSSSKDILFTVLFGVLGIGVLYLSVKFMLTADWATNRENLKSLIIGKYPDDQIWRLVVMVCSMSLMGGLLVGVVVGREKKSGDSRLTSMSFVERLFDRSSRFFVLALVAVATLALTQTVGPALVVAGVIVSAIAGRLLGFPIGQFVASSVTRWLYLLFGVVTVGLLYFIVAPLKSYDEIGGFLLNTLMALVSIVLCYPLGVVLALGRRSKLRLIRILSSVYIELVRGSPLFVLLLFAKNVLDLFTPVGSDPTNVTRATVTFSLFTAAYMAEIIRGGLQSLPAGQEEAAKALGLSQFKQTRFVILPQALRNVIPAQIGQLIALFKDTVLAGAAMGLFEVLDVANITLSKNTAGMVELLLFVALLFWAVSYTMSRESQRLEKRLGIGVR